jgi:ABC-type antimicrobial peptide transport system permease subunit
MFGIGLFRENVKIALGSIRTQLLRTILTIIIITIGITAVVGILTVVAAFENNLNSTFASMGSNTFNINQYKTQLRGNGGVNKIENAINQVFNVEVQLPIASYCTTNNVSEMVKKISNLLINEQTKTEVETKVANIDDIAIELLPINFVKTINVKLSQNEELKNKINQIYNEQLTKNPLTYLKSKGIVPYIFLVPNYITGVGFVTTGLAVKIGNTPITVSMNLGTDPKNIPSSLKFSQVRMNFPINK